MIAEISSFLSSLVACVSCKKEKKSHQQQRKVSACLVVVFHCHPPLRAYYDIDKGD